MFTNSKNVVTVKDTEEGTVTLPLQLDAGNYTIEEIKTPKGFLDLDNPIQFTITNTRDYDRDKDEDPILTIKVKNAQPKAEVKINKTITDLDTDKDLVDRFDLSKIQFELKAKDNIYSSIDGSLLFKKDQNKRYWYRTITIFLCNHFFLKCRNSFLNSRLQLKKSKKRRTA